jgi:predicted permease
MKVLTYIVQAAFLPLVLLNFFLPDDPKFSRIRFIIILLFIIYGTTAASLCFIKYVVRREPGPFSQRRARFSNNRYHMRTKESEFPKDK